MAGHLLLVFPVLLTYIFHHTGREFWDYVFSGEKEEIFSDLLKLHICLFLAGAAACLCLMPILNYVIHHGANRRNKVHFCYCLSRIVASLCIGTSLVIVAHLALVIGRENIGTNSEIVSFSGLFCLASFFVVYSCCGLVFRAGTSYQVAWLIVVRSITSLHVGAMYVAFWVV